MFTFAFRFREFGVTAILGVPVQVKFTVQEIVLPVFVVNVTTPEYVPGVNPTQEAVITKLEAFPGVTLEEEGVTVSQLAFVVMLTLRVAGSLELPMPVLL